MASPQVKLDAGRNPVSIAILRWSNRSRPLGPPEQDGVSNARVHHWPNWAYSGRIELVVWAIPAFTVMLLGGVAWIEI
jgi:hypothetical protein